MTRPLESNATPQVTVLTHSLVQHHLAGLRNRQTRPHEFRSHVRVLSTILAVHATSFLSLKPVSIETPLEQMTGHLIAGRIAAVPILRAGLGMVEPLLDFLPELEVWHLGVYRNEETATPVHYYDKLPADHPPETAFVLDPMLATGGSAEMVVDALRKWGVPEIVMLAMIAAPAGVERLTARFPDLKIVTCAIDRELNDRAYILPGLGDAGDRIFNTLK
ncbi:MAG: uracil phosphoribosyltransferase [Planctomycetaceae bacterium]|nr:uracil phosphoribosyltransferase [Planctomycetaceae bacterium]